MKRTVTTYHCDICRAEIDEGQGVTDYHGRHYGLCDIHTETHLIEKHRLPESGGYVVRIVDAFEPEEAASP